MLEKHELVSVFNHTLIDLERGKYVNSAGEEVSLSGTTKLRKKTEFFDKLKPLSAEQLPKYNETRIYVQNIDTFDKVAEFGPKGVCLNMASSTTRGGGVLHGSRAQEECLCRRSDLYLSLSEVNYPLPTFGGVYSPGVTVFKDSNYERLDNPFTTNVISLSALKHPKLTEDGMIERKYLWILKEKIRAILRIAILHNHSKIVLGAFGCGAYKCPAKHVAQIFKKVLQEPEFATSFEEICFAIIEDLNSKRLDNKEGNLKPFVETFEQDK